MSYISERIGNLEHEQRTRKTVTTRESIFNKTEDCLLFLRLQRLISPGDVDRIRRKLEKRMAEPPKN